MEENNYSPNNLSENNEQPFEPIAPLIIDDNIKLFLRETIKWSKFLSIIGFVFTALIGLIGLGIMVGGSAITSKIPMANNFIGGFIGFIYLLMGLLYYFPSKYLYDFSFYTRQALDINDQESLSYSFSKLKSFYKFWGVLMVFMLILYGFLIIFIVGLGFFASSLVSGQSI